MILQKKRVPVLTSRSGTMPEKLEKSLMAQARKKGLKGKAKDRYVYGTLTRIAGPKGAAKEATSGKIRRG